MKVSHVWLTPKIYNLSLTISMFLKTILLSRFSEIELIIVVRNNGGVFKEQRIRYS